MVHKKEEGTCHCIEKLMKEILCKNPISLISVLGVACLLLSPLTGTDKGTEGSREIGNSTSEIGNSFLTIKSQVFHL